MTHLSIFPATYWLYPVSYYLMTHVYSKMSESLEDIEKIVETDNGSSTEPQTNSRSSGYCNGYTIDHTYLRSIEGILRVITLVSVKNQRGRSCKLSFTF